MKESHVHENLLKTARSTNLDIEGGRVRRSSSRFCLSIEHGDYNGLELFGVGTDRFIWLAYKANTLGRVRIFSKNFPEDGTIDMPLNTSPAASEVANSWSRFPFGVNEILRRSGFNLHCGFDAVLTGNIPGGGMSRSASLSLNLLATMMEVNGIKDVGGMEMVNLAQRVENEYIGSPCGKLDQIMITFAKAGMGTYYDPLTEKIEHIPFGGNSEDFRLVSLDTGTKRPGLEKSTYKIRRQECDALNSFLLKHLGKQVSAIDNEQDYQQAMQLLNTHDIPVQSRLKYLYEAKQRFPDTLNAWRDGDIQRVGNHFRADGIGLRDDYEISGPELETMCDIARTVEGVYGERMLGGGDKGASGAIIEASAFDRLKQRIETSYPKSHPQYADYYKIHPCRTVDGIQTGPLLVNS